MKKIGNKNGEIFTAININNTIHNLRGIRHISHVHSGFYAMQNISK